MKRGKKIKIVESKNNESEIDNKTSFYKSKRKELQTKQNHKGRGQRTWKEKKNVEKEKVWNQRVPPSVIWTQGFIDMNYRGKQNKTSSSVAVQIYHGRHLPVMIVWWMKPGLDIMKWNQYKVSV